MNNTLSRIGLEKGQSENIANHLNSLLANYEVFYQNLRGFHWNIKGENFFELHAKFEELYNDAQVKIDEIAERILTLGYRPLHSYSAFINESSIQEATNISNGKEAVGSILAGFSELIMKERKIMEVASEASDEGTISQMSAYIEQQEKVVWMLSSWLGE